MGKPVVLLTITVALTCILDFIVDSYAELTVRLNTKIGDIEATHFHSEFDREAIQNVYSLRRNLLGLRNAAQPVEEICTELIRIHEELIPKPLRAYFRDIQNHASHVVTDVNDIRELLSSAMHVNLALVSVQQNEVVKKLTGWGAILVIPSVVFSMYGMNFDNMPELKTLYGYPATIAVTLGACVLLWLRLKRSRWLKLLSGLIVFGAVEYSKASRLCQLCHGTIPYR